MSPYKGMAKIIKKIGICTIIGVNFIPVYAKNAGDPADTTAINKNVELQDVVVEGGKARKMSGVVNGDLITTRQLFRAACCSLGESFTTNPSVDVNYADAATGAKQIKLLGLSGTYVQVMTENVPNYRGAAIPYYLGYIPGTWMQSIQVSKGCSSVKNGYESITGQINVEFKKPQAPKFIEANFYVNTHAKMEANFAGNWKLADKLTTALLLHGEMMDKAHDGNDDGFIDMPKTKQYNVMNRWCYKSDKIISQASVKATKEWRDGGQTGHGLTATTNPYLINIDNERFEVFAKNAYIINRDMSTNIALILSGSLHNEDASFGNKAYGVDEKNAYASLLFETDFDKHNSISAGLSLNHDYLKQNGLGWIAKGDRIRERETVPGVYAQYTYKIDDKLTLMGGLRADNSNIHGTFVTPRAHVKISPVKDLSFRLSAGKGYRTSHPLAENNFLLASSREIIVDDDIRQEEAWNYGASAQWDVKVFGKKLNLSAEYCYTNFINQLVIDMDSDPHAVHFSNLDGKSYSHTMQFEATYPFFKGFTLTGTYRRTIVKSTYGGTLMEKPLTSRYKGLLTASYKPHMGLWQFDVTLQMNGGGRMPSPYTMADGSQSWNTSFKAYQQLSAQITREFRHVAIYAGGENMCNFKQKNPIVDASNPWGSNFDSTVIWGPIHGAVYYIGCRLHWN